MSENDQTLPDTDQRPKVSLTKREQIMRNADKILADMNLRKDVVGSLLTHKELQPNWAKVRQNSLNFNKSGQLLANPVVSKLFEEAEPLMNQFQVRWFKAKIPCPFRGWSWRSFLTGPVCNSKKVCKENKTFVWFCSQNIPFPRLRPLISESGFLLKFM